MGEVALALPKRPWRPRRSGETQQRAEGRPARASARVARAGWARSCAGAPTAAGPGAARPCQRRGAQPCFGSEFILDGSDWASLQRCPDDIWGPHLSRARRHGGKKPGAAGRDLLVVPGGVLRHRRTPTSPSTSLEACREDSGEPAQNLQQQGGSGPRGGRSPSSRGVEAPPHPLHGFFRREGPLRGGPAPEPGRCRAPGRSRRLAGP